ncbi:MAG: hypothetical protein DRO04_00975, partial [Candidatus Iainarchaeum archaeon]
QCLEILEISGIFWFDLDRTIKFLVLHIVTIYSSSPKKKVKLRVEIKLCSQFWVLWSNLFSKAFNIKMLKAKKHIKS